MRYKQESGRSMVEIIGVIAIMSLLSFGALKGYDSMVNTNDSGKIITTAGEVYAIAKVKKRTTSAIRERLTKTLPNTVKDIEVTKDGLARITLIKCVEADMILNLQARYGYCTTIPDEIKNADGSLKVSTQDGTCSFSESKDLFDITIDLSKANCK